MSGFAIKILAALTMLIDHIGEAFRHSMPEPAYLLCKITGRLAMPLFCFLVAEGLFYTKNAKRYLTRLAIFALVSEMPFDLLFNGTLLEFRWQNVGFTLFLGLLGILLFDTFAARGQKWAALAAIIAAGAAAYFIRSDYTVYGVYFIFIFYYFRNNNRGRSIALAAGVFLYASEQWLTPGMPGYAALITAAAVFAAIPAALYNGKKGRGGRYIQTAFYAFYPLHLLVLYMVKLAVG